MKLLSLKSHADCVHIPSGLFLLKNTKKPSNICVFSRDLVFLIRNACLCYYSVRTHAVKFLESVAIALSSKMPVSDHPLKYVGGGP